MANNTHETTIRRELSLRAQIAVFIVSVLGAALASGTAVLADFAVRLDKLSICGGVLLVVGGLLLSFFALNLGIYSGSRRDLTSTLLVTAMAMLPAVLIGISRLQWDRASLVFGMALVGWSGGWRLSRRLPTVERAHGVISQLRPALAMVCVTFGAFIYVIAPSLEIMGE